MSNEKRVIDLIYITPPKSVEELVADYRQKMDIWGKKLKDLQTYYFEQHADSAGPDVQEVLAMRNFLGKFLKHRIDWILEKTEDPKLRRRYLQVLPPFHQKGAIKTLLFHFFQLKESEDKKNVLYNAATDIEKEVRILWDIYKLRKTIESITVLQKALEDPNPFPSLFSVPTRIQRLEELKTVFKLMFQMCIQPQFQKDLYNNLSPSHISPEAILARQEQGVSLVYPHVIRKFDYRNHFFFVYFYSGMKAKIGGEVKDFRFNYLDFEIIKQEFLTFWLNKRLEGNDKKMEIYARYKLGDKTLAELIAENPADEIEILQQLPYEIFNDLTAQVNEEVAPEFKTEVETFSENHGEFAEVRRQFDRAKKVATLSILKIKELLSSPAPAPEPPPEAPKPVAAKPAPAPPAAPITKPEPRFELVKVKKTEIDFPYLVKAIAEFSKRINVLRAKMGAQAYQDYTKRMTKFLSNTTESAMIQRRTPKHEWVLPYVVKEFLGNDLVQEHLVIVGAEVKAKGLGMGYSANAGQNAYQFSCFFVYGVANPDGVLGTPVEQRQVRGKNFNEYSPAELAVRERFLRFFDLIDKPSA
ncbi:MAG: hypothetical protein A2600_03965 [Candidatus Lambdaproteobacteria bacterium RIFOXYD1_FULL_56_27]|uniref:Uncharacterized protein n=1 Tax=Candidatus Lambdaproteobacteria bacterium RIFOXYD2_FULL_56_26 TaxID=1817773 RepID=A0A1F6H3M6_9PROT|nr:MAG: hypothetical protein A2426_01765 [Candidatus Lambdaproteobacteria bacterium RIFOXYC1_FULL_56_13]OGH04914.1 MAG: hypothetical protein A2557_08030 [Candidatus Lambdaproteobacteria bacterium RIFOXYD2_FULL_56_26]OGH09378.1 MAG: hypothetical protein A2600_03965 [Candidatus Lambdaproteobacteria bacterium RIFOXYD1_FULL_56_27]